MDKKRLLLLAILVMSMLWLPRVLQPTPSAAGSPYKVHIALGFHVNLYHSFRGDTNDENGFGQDIRVIRHTIGELDRFNRAGVPVSAVWDFDNLFSLQELLPTHAPDIIRDVQRRVRENRDEVILMSYNNGLASAMNHSEFMASVEKAISNEEGSGVRDIFGKVAPVVRPQEMMTTPGNFKRYRELGIEYVSMYYSATPFDAFRMFSRELTPTEAHNPITYENPHSGEEIVVIPTYHAGDLVEHVSLRDWAEKLHRLQSEGKLDRDVLIFLNFDADADFWTGADLPWHLDWLPNTGGLGQLVDSVADLDFVSFTKLGDYLKDHSPEGRVRFSQDTADGSYNGYNSWAEKAYASDYWTRIVRNRRACQMARKASGIISGGSISPELETLLERSFNLRMRALSTTNFGLATPFLARQREAVMGALLEDMDGCSERLEQSVAAQTAAVIKKTPPPRPPLAEGRLVETFVHLNPAFPGGRGEGGNLDVTLPAAVAGGSRYFIADISGRRIPATLVKRRPHPDGRHTDVSLRVSKAWAMPDGIYFLYLQTDHPQKPAWAKQTVFADGGMLRNGTISVSFDATGHITGVTREGEPQLDAGSLVPYLIHKDRRLAPEKLTLTVEENGESGVASVRLHGPWDGPPGNTRAPGWVDYRLRLVRDLPYLFIDGVVRYPDTYRRQVTEAGKPMLARKIDAGWEAVAPVELRFSHRARREAPFIIHKRNYLGEEAAYAVDYFRHSPRNLDVASINNHITASYAGVTASGKGMAVAMNPAVNANFAFCPFKMTHSEDTGTFSIRANPFGTYDGSQILPPTRGNRQGYEAVLLSAPQLHSAGPTYNGYHDRFELMVSFFDGDAIPEAVKTDLIAFARRPMTLGTQGGQKIQNVASAPLPPAGFLALPYGKGVVFHWETTGVPGTTYRIRCSALPGSEERVFTSRGTTLFVEKSALSDVADIFTATIEALHPDTSTSKPSPEIRFRFGQVDAVAYDIPLEFKAKVLWANVSAWVRRIIL